MILEIGVNKGFLNYSANSCGFGVVFTRGNRRSFWGTFIDPGADCESRNEIIRDLTPSIF